MIKRYLFISIFFTSCASIDYGYFNDLKNYYSKNKILIDESFISKQDYSFIKVSNSKNDAVFILSNIDQFGVYEWIGSNYESIKTKDGLIIETKGLLSDIKFYDPPWYPNDAPLMPSGGGRQAGRAVHKLFLAAWIKLKASPDLTLS